MLAAGPMLAHSRAELAAAGVARISLGSGLARVGQGAILAAARAALGPATSAARRRAPGAEIDALLARGGRNPH